MSEEGLAPLVVGPVGRDCATLGRRILYLNIYTLLLLLCFNAGVQKPQRRENFNVNI